MWYKVQKIFVGTKQVRPELQLKLIFDFSTATSYWDYTYYPTSSSWLVIQNANWWVTNNWTNGNGMVYKSINAKRFWSRILFNFNTGSISWDNGWALQLWPFQNNWWIPNGATVTAYYVLQPNVKEFDLLIYGTKYAQNYTITQWVDYYMDLKLDDWVYTAILYDTNFNELVKISKTDANHNIVPYSWFSMWNWWISNLCRIKKYREAYD